jgi:hypothetical protein
MMGLRTVGITAVPHPMGRYAWQRPVIWLDGVPQQGEWRRGQWQLPADREVRIAVAFQGTGAGNFQGLAEYVLPPGGDVELEYLAPAFWTAPGALGPAGTVQRQGTGAHAKWVVFAGLGAVLLAVIAIGVAIPLIYAR